MSDSGSSAPSAPTASSGGAPTSSAPKAPSTSGASSSGTSSTPKPASTQSATQSTTSAPSKPAVPPQKRSLSDQVKKPVVETKPVVPAPKPEAKEPPAKKKFSFKIDGQEQSVEWDDNELHAQVQKSLAADKRLQEAAELRKKFENAKKYGRDNPEQAFKELFEVDLDQWAEKRIVDRYEEALKSPEEIERAKMQKELEGYKKREADAKTEQERVAKENFEREIWEKTESEFIQAVETLGFEPQFAKVAILPIMADIAEANLEHGLELPPSVMAAQAEKRLQTIGKKYIGGLTGDKLISFLGEDAVKDIIKTRLAKVQMAPADPTPEPTPEPPKTERKPLTQSQFRRRHLYGLE